MSWQKTPHTVLLIYAARVLLRNASPGSALIIIKVLSKWMRL